MNYINHLIGRRVQTNQALFQAIKSNDKTGIEGMLTKENVNCVTYQLLTPLHFCILYGDEELFSLLLTKNADREHMADDGFSPLMRAVYYNKKGMVQRLIAEGVDVNRQGRAGCTALAIACFRGKKTLMESLFWSGARVETVRDAVEYKDLTPAWTLIHLESLEKGRERLKILWILEKKTTRLPDCLVRESLSLI